MPGDFQIYFCIALLLSVTFAVFLNSYVCSKRFAPIDIGVWWLIFLSIYTIFPILSWLVTGNFSTTATHRLISTSYSEVVIILQIAVCYAIFFAIPYLFISRVKFEENRHLFGRINNFHFVVVILIFVVGIFVLQYVFSSISIGSGYENKYTNIHILSLTEKRVHKFISLALVISSILLIAGLLQRPKLRTISIIILPVLILISAPWESRGNAIFIMLAFLISWHVFVRNIPIWFWGLMLICGVLSFNLLGAIRSYHRLPEGIEIVYWMTSSGEFQHIFGNAVDLIQVKKIGGLDLSSHVRYSEFFAFLPQELLPFEKIRLADWFIEHFYPHMKSTGGGLAFGVVAQAIAGNGVIEAMMRGLSFGIVLGLITRLTKQYSFYWFVFPLYIFLLIRIFNSVRDTMYSFLSDTIQILVPFLIFMSAISWLFSRLYHYTLQENKSSASDYY